MTEKNNMRSGFPDEKRNAILAVALTTELGGVPAEGSILMLDFLSAVLGTLGAFS